MPRGGLNPLMSSKVDIEAARKKYFDWMKPKTFENRFRQKARDFSVTKTLNGHRARKFMFSAHGLSLIHFLSCVLLFRIASSQTRSSSFGPDL